MYARSIWALPLATVSLLTSGAVAARNYDDPNSVCLSYGIDFVSGGSYFINTLSNQSFTAVTQWSGEYSVALT